MYATSLANEENNTNNRYRAGIDYTIYNLTTGHDVSYTDNSATDYTSGNSQYFKSYQKNGTGNATATLEVDRSKMDDIKDTGIYMDYYPFIYTGPGGVRWGVEIFNPNDSDSKGVLNNEHWTATVTGSSGKSYTYEQRFNDVNGNDHRCAETSSDSAEKGYLTNLETTYEQYKHEQVSIYGIEKDSRYVNIPHDGSGVYLSTAYRDKYDLNEGGSITLKEKFTDKEYTFKISGFYDYPATIAVFMDAEAYRMTSGYQLWNSLLALGSGGWTGVGFTESRLKLMYLPENHTDFILSIVGEELGFITLLTVIVAYLILVFVGLRISVKARTRQGMLIAFGMSIFIGMQALINIGVITAAFPTKGMPAPMISYGGSNLLACLIAAACVASVAIDSAIPDYQEKLLAWTVKRLHFSRPPGTGDAQQSS